MAKSTFYYNIKQLAVADKYAEIRKVIAKIFHNNKGRYGYRRIAAELSNIGYSINNKTVLRIMHDSGLKCLVRIKRYRSYKGNYSDSAPNLLKRDFNTNAINMKWVTDVTQFSLCGLKCYLSPIIDLFNREVISYTISYHPNLKMVTDMLKKAFSKIPNNTNLILHSDQGWHYQHQAYRTMLKKKGIQQSMSRKGNCLDNAVAENFFGLLKSELLYLQKFSSIDEFLRELKKYIIYYNNYRIKLSLNGLSPVKFREMKIIEILK